MNDWILGMVFILVAATLLVGLERLCRAAILDINKLVKSGIMIVIVLAGAVIYYLPLVLGRLLRHVINDF